MGWLSVFECAFWGFLPLFALLHLFPLFRLFVKQGHDIASNRRTYSHHCVSLFGRLSVELLYQRDEVGRQTETTAGNLERHRWKRKAWWPGSVPCAGGLPGASVVAVGTVLLLLLSLVSGCSLMLLLGCTQGCWVPCVLPCFCRPRARWVFLRRRRLFGALFVCSRSCVVGPRSWAGSQAWSVPFGVSCCCLRCYTYSPSCVSL